MNRLKRQMLNLFFSLVLVGIIFPVYGKDLGILGETFPIQEESLLTFLRSKASGDLWKKIKTSLIEKAKNPSPVQGITYAKKNRSFFLDPSIKVEQNIVNDQGKVIVPAGTKINPLEKRPLSSGLLFFDGCSTEQLSWARKQVGNFKWILTHGNPMQLEELEKRPIYFDQTKIASHFHVQHIPAKVTQKGLFLLVEEFVLQNAEGL